MLYQPCPGPYIVPKLFDTVGDVVGMINKERFVTNREDRSSSDIPPIHTPVPKTPGPISSLR